MKKKIIFLSVIAIFSIAFLPSVSAIEFNELVNVNKSSIVDEFKNDNLRILFQKFKLNIDEKIDSQIIDFLGAFGILSAAIGVIIGILARLSVLSFSTILDVFIALTPIVTFFAMKIAKAGIVIVSLIIVINEIITISQEETGT